MTSAPPAATRRLPRTPVRWDWVAVVAASTAVVVLGVAFGREFLAPGTHTSGAGGPLVNGFVRWDGNYYRDIATEGYFDRPGQAPVHFLPGYPLVVRGVVAVTGLRVEAAMVFAAHACLLAAAALLARYTDRRHGAAHPGARSAALVVLGFFPPAVFFHMGYSESQFLLICVGALTLIDRGAHPLWVAALAALGTVTRPVGLALVPPALLYAWQFGGGRWRSAGWACICLPVALAGMAALMGYFDHAFGDPILFARGRDDLWRFRPELPPGEKLLTLLALEPVWDVFDPDSPAWWGRSCDSAADAVFSTYPANPVVFVLALGLTAWGAHRGLMNRYELLMTAGLLAIPYWAAGYDVNMVSMARYVTVVAPLYPVAGVLLRRAGPGGLAGLAGCGSVLMAGYAGRFAQGHWVM